MMLCGVPFATNCHNPSTFTPVNAHPLFNPVQAVEPLMLDPAELQEMFRQRAKRARSLMEAEQSAQTVAAGEYDAQIRELDSHLALQKAALVVMIGVEAEKFPVICQNILRVQKSIPATECKISVLRAKRLGTTAEWNTKRLRWQAVVDMGEEA